LFERLQVTDYDNEPIVLIDNSGSTSAEFKAMQQQSAQGPNDTFATTLPQLDVLAVERLRAVSLWLTCVVS